MINFNFGKKKPDIKQYAIIGIVLSSIIAALSQCTGVSQDGLWDLLDEVQRKYFPQTIINDFIIKDPEKLDRRIHRDVDRAIDDYWSQSGLSKAEVSKPRYIEEANDERYNAYGKSVAHKWLPFGTRLRVTNQSNGKSVIVRVNDRGPYVGGRDLDLSYGAFSSIASPSRGVANVCYAKI